MVQEYQSSTCEQLWAKKGQPPKAGEEKQIWIGAEDKLPRMLRAVFRGDPLRLRHQMELSNWKLDPAVAADAFASAKAATAMKMSFAHPGQPPAGFQPPARGKPAAKAQPSKPQ